MTTPQEKNEDYLRRKRESTRKSRAKKKAEAKKAKKRANDRKYYHTVRRPRDLARKFLEQNMNIPNQNDNSKNGILSQMTEEERRHWDAVAETNSTIALGIVTSKRDTEKVLAHNVAQAAKTAREANLTVKEQSERVQQALMDLRLPLPPYAASPGTALRSPGATLRSPSGATLRSMQKLHDKDPQYNISDDDDDTEEAAPLENKNMDEGLADEDRKPSPKQRSNGTAGTGSNGGFGLATAAKPYKEDIDEYKDEVEEPDNVL